MANRNKITIDIDAPKGFRRGLSQLKLFQEQQARALLMETLGWKSRQIYTDYRDGKREPLRSQAIAIETVFAKFRITENIWGDELTLQPNEA